MPILDFPPEETPTYVPAPAHRVLNREVLAYRPTPDGGPGARRRLAGRPAAGWAVSRGLAAAVVMAVALTIAVAVAVSTALAADGARLTSVQFDLGREGSEGSGGPLSAAGGGSKASYHSAAINDGGAEHIVRPLTGPVSVSLSRDAAAAVAAQLGGSRVGPSAGDFGDSLADALSSPSLGRFARIGSTGSPVALDLRYARPLGDGDYLLVQEAGGDAAIELTALDGDGRPLGPALVVGPRYQWNTGHATADGTAFWAGVVPADVLAPGQDVHGVRIATRGAELKVVALEPGPIPSLRPTAPAGTATPSPAPTSAEATPAREAVGVEPAFAAIGLEIGVVPAVAVDGAGCGQAIAGGGAAPEAGRSATFCFAVTNTGTVDVTDIAITDRRVGLVDAVLPRSEGPEVLAPGDRAVFYHFAIVEAGAGDGSAQATARPADDGSIEGDPQPDTAAASAFATAPATDETGGPGPEPEAEPAGLPGAEASSDRAEAGTPTPTVSPATTPPATTPGNDSGSSGAGIGPVESDQPPAALAMTGIPTDPWVLVVLAMGLIFFGYTTTAAFRRPPGEPPAEGGEPMGHDQLDALGFD
jgi:hypothetical protein